jgi:hypothetical protein
LLEAGARDPPRGPARPSRVDSAPIHREVHGITTALALVALAVSATIAPPAAALVTLDYTTLGAFTVQSAFLANCGIIARGSDALVVNELAPGLAVAGGASDAAIDGAESVSFELNEEGEARTSRQVVLAVAAAPGGDGDELLAEVSVEAFGPDDELLGTAAFSGEGAHDLSLALGAEQIASFTLVPDPDPVRILGVSYAPPGSAEIRVGFYQIGALQAASLSLCGVTLSGSGTLNAADFGVGVLGGDLGQGDRAVDHGESLTVELEQATAALRYRPWSGYGPSPFRVDFTIEAFDAEEMSLGPLALGMDALQEFDVTALYGGAEIAGFDLLAGDPTDGGQGLGFVSYAVPEPGASALGAAAVGALAALARRRPAGT